MTSKIDGVGRHATQLADNGDVDDEHRQRNDDERRQVDQLPDVVLHQPLLVLVVQVRLRVGQRERERERENLFAKSDNNIASNITQYTMAGCQGRICPSMLAAYDKKQ